MLFILLGVAFAAGGLALLRFSSLKLNPQAAESADFATIARLPITDPDLWSRSLDKVKEPRAETENVALEIPTQLRHYEDRHWFLATQVAEVKKYNVHSAQDFVDLAAMIQRREMVPVPAVTDTYILFGVGAKADDRAFTRWVGDQSVELDDDAKLRDVYARVDSEHADLQKEISVLEKQVVALKHGSAAKQTELLTELEELQQELQANEEDRKALDQSFGSTESRQRLWRDFESLQALAKNFNGRSFNLDDAADRQVFKVNLLSALRPQALTMLEEIAEAYHDKFARPLPVSSLVRPEQYQHVLRRYNRYAVLIDTPPHSTGLAFDIDYRYLSGAEQNFLMSELARLKDEGRIEVIRERGANYHVFVFLNGRRPSDELITASLEDAGAPVKESAHAETAAAKPKPGTMVKPRSARMKRTTMKSAKMKPRSRSKARKHR